MKRYEIAGLQVDMDVSGQTALRAAPYEVKAQGPADIVLTCDDQQILDLNPHLQSLDLAQYMGTGRYFFQALLQFDGVYLHSSAVMLDGKAYLFSAPSGTGKSTHTEKWCRLFGATYINDDKPVLRCQDGLWIAYGTPWSGKHDLSTPAGYPVGGIAFVHRGEENRLERLQPADALSRFLSQSLWKLSDKGEMSKQLQLVGDLLTKVPVWKLTCNRDDEAAHVARQGMQEGQLWK